MKNNGVLLPQFTSPNNFLQILQQFQQTEDSLTNWLTLYFLIESTTLESSRKEKRRDIHIFIDYLIKQAGDDLRIRWTPRFSKNFQGFLQSHIENGKRRWSDRTVNRITTHLKTFSKWIHKMKPFELGDPMEKIKTISVGHLLNIERGTTEQEKDRMLDAADLLITQGKISRDRKRYKMKTRPQQKCYRPYRNRAIIYLFHGSGMRRGGVVKILLDDVDFSKNKVPTIEKGQRQVVYDVSQEAMDAIKDYIEHERCKDNKKWQSPYLFLSVASRSCGKGQLNVRAINDIWNQVAKKAGVEGKTPHSARHGMGSYIIKKSGGNPAAVQDQLNQINAIYAMNYSRITHAEKQEMLNSR